MNTKHTRKDLFLQWCRKNNIARGVIIGLLGANITTAYFDHELKQMNEELNQDIYTMADDHMALKHSLLNPTDLHANPSMNQKLHAIRDGKQWLETISDIEQVAAYANPTNKGDAK